MTESDMTNNSIPKAKLSTKKIHEMDEVSTEVAPMVEQDDERMFWIGIGASAGGLEALRELVSTLPKHATMPATYIVAQHLSPKHQSMLVQLVG